MSLNWDDMRVFLAVAREGSLSAAARRLGVTQPTAGRRLRALEESLSARLFDRLPQGFLPTPAGSELLPLAEAMERSAEAVARRQPALADRLHGTVRISMGEVTAQFLAPRLPALRARLPEIELELAVSHLLANLSRREADLVIRDCLPESPGLIARRLGRFAFAVYGARDYVAANPAALTEARFRDCAWVGYDEEHHYFSGQDWLLSRLEGRLPAVRFNDAMVLQEALRAGTGLGVVACFAADTDPSLVRLTPPIEAVDSTKHLIVHQDLRRVPRVRAVMDALVELFESEAEALAGGLPERERRSA
ncbi:transcriptional regulator, LysR family [Tistlia consotensis]|uniref:DNA-binding transcriptional regulator, LysR family n=1 Tax=Tistlia consotensis USBA 355 TaxID=560819 RepID=A0A1Y6CQ69_9PROT|nr:LysR family transcriptional regulator [Tistlia consotensis]SMF81196.1 DNA-binding transcriptional regulator, LysR family [Tistlia consotensis USBA 355]SNS23329.1 transcriptional regulator, LysR family [Tistlia consotensis]